MPHRQFDATLEEGQVVIRCDYNLGAYCKQIPGVSWSAVKRAWICPATPETLERVRGVKGAQIDGKIMDAIGMDFEPAPDPIPEDMEGIIAKMPVKVRPYAHQVAAFKRALEVLDDGFVYYPRPAGR
jgi:hypothetical protein